MKAMVIVWVIQQLAVHVYVLHLYRQPVVVPVVVPLEPIVEIKRIPKHILRDGLSKEQLQRIHIELTHNDDDDNDEQKFDLLLQKKTAQLQSTVSSIQHVQQQVRSKLDTLNQQLSTYQQKQQQKQQEDGATSVQVDVSGVATTIQTDECVVTNDNHMTAITANVLYSEYQNQHCSCQQVTT